jgi:hypothetical protein
MSPPCLPGTLKGPIAQFCTKKKSKLNECNQLIQISLHREGIEAKAIALLALRNGCFIASFSAGCMHLHCAREHVDGIMGPGAPPLSKTEESLRRRGCYFTASLLLLEVQ